MPRVIMSTGNRAEQQDKDECDRARVLMERSIARRNYLMYLRLVYFSGDRSLIESIGKDQSAGIVADKMFFLDAVDNDGDALRFQHNNGSHFDVIFLRKENALSVYEDLLTAIREKQNLTEMDIRERQV